MIEFDDVHQQRARVLRVYRRDRQLAPRDRGGGVVSARMVPGGIAIAGPEWLLRAVWGRVLSPANAARYRWLPRRFEVEAEIVGGELVARVVENEEHEEHEEDALVALVTFSVGDEIEAHYETALERAREALAVFETIPGAADRDLDYYRSLVVGGAS